MRDQLKGMPEIINLAFNVLDLLVVRLVLLGLTAIGAYTLLVKR